jgi:hypothetical protein
MYLPLFQARKLLKNIHLNTTVRTLVSVIVAALMLAPAGFAQFRASIQGTVADAQGGVIPGAKLTLTNTATNETQMRTSNDVGIFNFNALPSGRFKLVVERDGFQTKALDNVQVIPEQANSLNVQLEVGGATQTVTVDASLAPLMDSQTATIGGTISENQIQHMPSFGRDVFQLTQLAPGTTGDASQSAGGGSNALPGTQGPGGPSANGGIFQTENGPQALANGGQYESNGISIDGISTTSAVWGGTSVITPTEDSVDNVRVVANGYDAENGRFSGAQIQVTSKSGTNNVHGSAFFQAYRPGLNAYQRYNGTGFYNFLAPDGTPNPPSQRNLFRDPQQFNQMGGSVGGPLWRNKIFAFFAYETERIHLSGAPSSGWYDTTAFDGMAPTGSIASKFLTFPGAGVNSKGIIDQKCSVAGLTEGVNCIYIPGQGLNIGSPLTSPLGTQDLGWTTPTSPGVGGGLNSTVADIAFFATANPTDVVDEQYNGRLDADVTSKDHASFAIYWVPTSQTQFNGPARPYNLWHHTVINDAFSVIWNHTFSPTFLNEARANAAGWRFNEVAANAQEAFGLPNDSVGTIGNINLQNFGAPGPGDLNQWTYTYRDIATKVLRNHTIKFGGELTRLYYLNIAPYAARPNFGFFNIWDFLNDAPRSESGTFNPTTGVPFATRQDNREDLWGFFAQDDWKATPNLTLNLGLRYGYYGPLTSKQGNMYSVRFGSGSAMLTGLTVQKGGSLWTAQKFNFGPQVGFAWTPAFYHQRVVIRGGFGLNYNEEEIAISANVFGNPGATVSPSFTMNLPSSPNPGIVYQIPSDVHSLYGYPPNPNTISSAFGTNGLPLTGQTSVTAFDTNMPTMYSEHYSLDTQTDLGAQFIFTLGYQGSVSRHSYFHYDANAAASVRAIPLNPQVPGVNFFGNGGHGNYNAMLAGLKHQFSRQFMMDAELTWGKSMDTSSAPYSEQDYPYNPSLSYGRSDYNIGRQFKIFGMWQPVIFHSSHSWAEKIVGGWSLSGIFNMHTGFPWNPVFNSDKGSLYCDTCGYYQVLPAAYLGGAGNDTSNEAFKSGPGVGNGLNKNFPLAATSPNQAEAYFVPPALTAGSVFPATGGVAPQAPGVKRNSWTGPGYRDLDGTVSKSFGLPNMKGLGEHAAVEFRADAFNLFNNLNFNPTSIANNITDPSFGQAKSALGSRTVTLQARFNF